MPGKETFIGIDVATDVLDVAVRPTGEECRVANDEAGMTGRFMRLRALRPTLIVLEATARLHVAAAGPLAEASLPVQTVNPRQARDFGKATGKLAKTDAIDARCADPDAEYAIGSPPPPARRCAAKPNRRRWGLCEHSRRDR